ncbi:uncharacterized protein LOC109140113 isoform X1 [Larimichthys crocea]|uniref:uncharacterized protein LOC109140113 isoform X1 n=1 Tax=Larimichthys crocea TaxID=215358 RepID=UPI000F5E6693|nr:uncharacterized protein LOC109140113 isoform X1 [Larimichthys crocea]
MFPRQNIELNHFNLHQQISYSKTEKLVYSCHEYVYVEGVCGFDRKNISEFNPVVYLLEQKLNRHTLLKSRRPDRDSIMSIFVILGLLVCIEAPGSSAVTPVFVKKGDDLLLNVTDDDDPQRFIIVVWKFRKSILVSFSPDGKPTVSDAYTGRVETSVKKFSVKLKNLQEADSGVYTARVTAQEEQTLAEYNVTVQAPVSPVGLTVDSVSSSSDSCNLTVTCSTQDSHISSTLRCDTQTCSQEGGERSEVTTSGASLHVYLVNDSIICNHSNQVSWTENMMNIQDFCPQHAGISVCLVKTVVFSVGLIIMVSAVITVHIMEKLKKKKL